MRNLLNPKWLLVLNTLPILILFGIFYGEYQIIKSLLSEESITLWIKFGACLAFLGTVTLGYGLFLLFKKKELSLYYGFVALLFYIAFLYLYGNYSSNIIPFNIPRWMVPVDMLMYVGTFLMPTLAHAVFILVAGFTPEEKEHKAGQNFLIAFIIPVSWYLFVQLILPFWRNVDFDFNIHVLVIFIIVGTLAFLFFLIRGIYVLGLKKASTWFKYQLAWKIPIAVVFPLLGLAVNNGLLFNNFHINSSGVFGNFNDPSFYILAFVNGTFVCLPNLENKAYRVFLFIGRSVTFVYTFYFFLVFLPFLPLSVLAIVAAGTGFLMLTPLVLMVIHIRELSADYQFLQSWFSKKLMVLMSLASFSILPTIVTINYLGDRKVLYETLDYLYHPDYSKSYDINKNSLSKILAVVQEHKERNADFIFGNQIPYLSSYFNWLVLDNMTLSDTKISTIEKVFYNRTSFDLHNNRFMERNTGTVKSSSVKTKSSFDKKQQAWISWVDLEMTNQSTNTWVAEYSTSLDLPPGCWISDYYLYVGNKKEYGILAEKKAATWVFSQIQNENRDPGILYYQTGNKVSFKVFPFAASETRKTGIEFIHKEPIEINIDGNKIALGDKKEQPTITNTSSVDGNVVYVSPQEKAKLKEVQRTPYYHFIIDVSEGKEKNKNRYIQQLETLLNKNTVKKEQTKISFSNTYSTAISFDKDWKEKINRQSCEGGFYVDRAIKKVLFDSYTSKAASYPVMVVLTDNFFDVILEKDFSDFSMAYPETDLFYEINSEGKQIVRSLSSTPKNSIGTTDIIPLDTYKVLAWPTVEKPTAYLANNSQPSIVIKEILVKEQEEKISEKNWQSALTMQGKWLSQVFHPETAEKEWVQLVKYSFISKIMNPLTSYIVVENEAQKAILKKKQEQVLSSNQSLDLGEDIQRMSEPGLIVMIGLLGLFLGIRKIKKHTFTKELR